MQEKQYSTIVFGIAFSILLLFAYLFAIERVLFQDASVMIFKIINEKKRTLLIIVLFQHLLSYLL